jgi:thymidylate synthase
MEQIHDFEYLHLANTVLDTGVEKGDRTGTGTTSSFAHRMEFNISDGTIPLLTGKKMHIPSIIKELVDWYIKGDSSAYNLQRRGVRIWNEWADADGNLGPVYGHLWRGWPASDATSITAVRDRSGFGVDANFEFKHKSDRPKSMIGGVNAYGEKYTIDGTLEDIKDGQAVTYYHISFDDTGYHTTITNKQRLSGKFRDPYALSVMDVGCIGEGEFRPSYRKRAYDLWRNMIRDVYHHAGAQLHLEGYFVDRDWRCFYNFLLDLPRIPGFYKWLNGMERMELTPQYYSSRCYCANTCVFVPASMIDRETKEMEGMKLAIKAVRGNRTIIDYNLERLSKKTGIEPHIIMREVHTDSPRQLNSGWTFEVTGSPLGSTFRPTLYIDQLEDVIHRLKTNPDDRRLLITAWNPGLVPEMQLPPCHYTFQFYTRPLSDKERMDLYFERTGDARIYDDYYTWDDTPAFEKLQEQNIPTRAISCMMNQRSADVFLGVPFNIAQYSILTHMVAQVVNMQPDRFIWNGGDTHIYSNHVDQLMEQFGRVPFTAPKISLNKSVDKIDDFTYDDIVIEGYQSHGTIKAKVAV